MGLPVAIIYLITLFLFIPFPFINWFEGANLVHEDDPTVGTFPYNKVSMAETFNMCLLMSVLCSWARYYQPY
jgi:UDP-N-acetylglucosamine--dolichyl-phosphate N-acetylglucosaminephosphotransferase